MEWDDLRFFLSVARAGGLTEASRRMHTSVSTVSRRIDALEGALAATLFTRHPKGYELTDAGREMLARLEPVESEIALLQKGIGNKDEDLAGTVRLATSIAIANILIVPALPEFRARHPGITLEIATGIGNIGLTKREADLALRLTAPAQGRLAVRRIGRVAHGIYGASAYVREHCPERTMEEIKRCGFVLWDEGFRDIPMARWLDKHLRPSNIALVANDLTTHIAAAKAGAGLAILPSFCAARNRGLECVIPPDKIFHRDLFLVIHDDVRRSARVRAVADFIVDTIRNAAPELSGTRQI